MKNKRSIFIAMSLFLYGLVTFGSFLRNYEPGLSILIHEHPNLFLKNTPMLAGNKVTFEIVSPHNGLGIVAVRFRTYGRVNDDVLTFRMKPKGASTWTYSANYKTDQFQDGKLFPFGYPVIPDSKNGTYLIQLESLSGTEDNHVSVDTGNPIIVSKYHYPQTTSKNIQFGFRKAFNLLSNSSTAFPILFYFCPFLLYLLNLFSIFKRKKPSYFSILFPATLMLSAYFLKLPVPDYWELTLALTWLVYVLVSKVSYRFSVALSLLAALYLVIQSLKNDAFDVDQAGQWLYYSLLLAIIQVKAKSY